MTVRLVDPAVVEEMAADLRRGFAAAAAEQHRTVGAALSSHGLTWASPARTSLAQVWAQDSWAKAVEKHLQPAAAKVAAKALAAARSRTTARSRWGMDDPTQRLVALVVDRAVTGGLGVVKRVQRPMPGLTAAGGNVQSIRDALDGALDQMGRIVDTSAQRVANAASNAVATAADANSSDSLQRQWNTVGDDRVRDSHQDADQQTVGMGDPYQVGGTELAYPGDPDGPEEETESCRCWETYLGMAESLADGPGGNEDAITEAADEAADAASTL